MWTKDQLNGVTADSLDDIDQLNWLVVFRGYSKYQANPGRYPKLEETLASLDGSTAKKKIQAKQLILTYQYLHDEIGFGTEALTPTVKSSIDFSNVRDLEQVLDFALNVLYDTAKLVMPQTSAISAQASIASLRGDACGRCGGLRTVYGISDISLGTNSCSC